MRAITGGYGENADFCERVWNWGYFFWIGQGATWRDAIDRANSYEKACRG